MLILKRKVDEDNTFQFLFVLSVACTLPETGCELLYEYFPFSFFIASWAFFLFVLSFLFSIASQMCVQFNDGLLLYPASLAEVGPFFEHFFHVIATEAAPTAYAAGVCVYFARARCSSLSPSHTNTHEYTRTHYSKELIFPLPP